VEAATGSSAVDGCLGLDLGIESCLMNGFDGLGVDCEGLQSDFLGMIWFEVLMDMDFLKQKH